MSGVELVVQLAPGATKTPGGAPSDTHVQQVLTDFGATLSVMHPGANDPGLSRYFVVLLTDVTQAERLAGQLRRLNGIAAAYVKPAGEPP